MFKTFTLIKLVGDFDTSHEATCIVLNIDDNNIVNENLTNNELKEINAIFNQIHVKKKKVGGMDNLFSFKKTNKDEVKNAFIDNGFKCVDANVDYLNEYFCLVEII